MPLAAGHHITCVRCDESHLGDCKVCCLGPALDTTLLPMVGG